jgi:hypothetical protein
MVLSLSAFVKLKPVGKPPRCGGVVSVRREEASPGERLSGAFEAASRNISSDCSAVLGGVRAEVFKEVSETHGLMAPTKPCWQWRPWEQ